MKIVFNGDHSGMKKAVAFANALGGNAAFWDEVSRKTPPFSHTSMRPAEVAARIRDAHRTVTVQLWTPSLLKKPFYRNTVAFFDGDDPDTLFYHTAFLTNSVGEMVNTVVHEYIHAIDDDGEFGHGDNSPGGKEQSVPYWIGDLAEKHYNVNAGLGEIVKGVDLTHVMAKAADGQISR